MHTQDPGKQLDRQVNIRLSPSMHKEVSELAESITTSVSQIIREALIIYLNGLRKRGHR